MGLMSLAFDEAALDRSVGIAFAKKRILMKTTVKKTGDAVVEQAKQLAPDTTGRLRDGLTGTEDEDGDTVFVAIHSKAFYWYFVEFGTALEAARPFIRPAEAQGRVVMSTLLRSRL